ncbi:MAG: hypothetical protein IT385_20580 [Deltaproteobacteria bacterium]|nr:hypothetical protein [Deltaproteobacteria bacterium]
MSLSLLACSDGGPAGVDETSEADTVGLGDDVPGGDPDTASAPAEVEPSDTVPSDALPSDALPSDTLPPDTGAEPDLFVEPDAPDEITATDVAPEAAETADTASDIGGDAAPVDVSGADVGDTAGGIDTYEPDPVQVDGDSVRCLGHGWCWDLPTIGGAHVNGLWGATGDAIWAVGSGGAISFYDGQGWLAVDSPVEVDLEAVHGTGPSDVWAVGADGEILHFDGQGWTRSSSGVSAHLRGVWARDTDDVWAVGNLGTVLRWDGVRWTQHATGVIRALRGVSGYGPDDVWMVGDHALILHYDGDAITQAFVINSASQLNGVVAVGPGECWAVGSAGLARHQFVGAGATHRLGGDDLFGIAATSFDDLWVVGDAGRVARWDGLDWESDQLARVGDLRALWTDGVVAKAGGRYGTRASFDDAAGSWGFEAGHLGSDAIVDLVVVDDERAHALTARSLYRRDVDGWERLAAVPMAEPAAMWVAADDDIWVVGADEAISRWSGLGWTPVAFDAIGTRDNHGVWGTSPADVFVAAGSDLYHWNGSLWLRQEQIESRVLEVSLLDDERQIVTSQTVYYRHWLSGWRAFDAPAAAPVFTSATRGADSRFYLTTSARVWIFDPAAEAAQAWRELVPPQFTIQGAWGLAANDVWVLGAGRDLRRWNGAAWSSPILVPVPVAFEFAASPEALFAYSWAGHVLAWRP